MTRTCGSLLETIVRRLRYAAVALCATVTAGAMGSFPRSSPAAYENYLAPARACPGSDTPTLVRTEQVSAMLCLVDYARATQGVGVLARAPLLGASAAIKAADIVRCDDFSHTACGRSVNAPFEEAGYAAPDVLWAVGENLAYGADLLGSPRSVMRDWLQSDEHRDNLLDAQWQDQGVALNKPQALLGLTSTAVWVSHFGRRAAAATAPGASPPALTLAVRPARVRSGRRIGFRFLVGSSTGARSPVRGATVSFASRRARTDASGRATIVARLRRPGRHRAVARKDRSRRATAFVRVVRR